MLREIAAGAQVRETCPSQPEAGKVLKFRKHSLDDNRHLCDKYTKWRKSHAARPLKSDATIMREIYTLIKPGNPFKKRISTRSSAVVVEYFGDPTCARIRQNARCPKTLLKKIDLSESNKTNLAQIPDLQSIGRIQKFRERNRPAPQAFVPPALHDHNYAKKYDVRPFQTPYSTLENFLISHESYEFPYDLKKDKDLSCLDVKGWLTHDVITGSLERFAKYVVGGMVGFADRPINNTKPLLCDIASLDVPKDLDQPIFVPVTYQSHCYLCVITRSYIFLLDSKYESESKKSTFKRRKNWYRMIFQKVLLLTEAICFLNDWPNVDYKLLVATDYMNQRDHTECGVIVVLAALCILQAWDFPIPQTIIRQERNRKYLHKLLSMKDPVGKRKQWKETQGRLKKLKSFIRKKLFTVGEKEINYGPCRGLITSFP